MGEEVIREGNLGEGSGGKGGRSQLKPFFSVIESGEGGFEICGNSKETFGK